MIETYLLLGSNEGDRQQMLQSGVEALKQLGDVTVQSPIYQTAAWGLQDQPDFLNKAVCLQTELLPHILLKHLNEIENNLKRQRTIRWGQRTLDIDILLYGQEIINTPDLTVPHPHMHTRRFTLQPLTDIAANVPHPVLHKTIAQLLDACPDRLQVERLS